MLNYFGSSFGGGNGSGAGSGEFMTGAEYDVEVSIASYRKLKRRVRAPARGAEAAERLTLEPEARDTRPPFVVTLTQGEGKGIGHGRGHSGSRLRSCSIASTAARIRFSVNTQPSLGRPPTSLNLSRW